jgi:hypothetical protein
MHSDADMVEFLMADHVIHDISHVVEQPLMPFFTMALTSC